MENKSKIKILITGSEGFIGQNLIRYIGDRAEIIRYDLALGDDILDYYKLLTKVQRANVVIHLAGGTGVPFSTDNPYYYYRYNVEGTAVVARVCSNLRVPMIHASTGDVNMENSHYAASKIGAEAVIRAERKVRGLKALIVRFLNLYGNGCPENYVIPIFIRKCQRGEKLQVFGAEQTKDFTNVIDIVKMLYEYAIKGFDEEQVTIGTGVQTSVKKLAYLIKKITGSNSEIEIKEEKRIGEVPVLKVDNFKLIGSSIPLQTGIIASL